MNYPDSYDSLTQPTPSTIRGATGGISPALTVQELIKISQLLESKLGLNDYVTFTANSGTDVFTATNHGLGNGDVLILKSTGSLPPELTTNTRYYVVNKATNTFQLATTSGGSAININSAGSGTHSFAVLIGVGKALVGAAGGVAGYSSVMPAGNVVGDSDTQTLYGKTLVEPTIASFVNATHSHQNAAGGGQLGVSALTAAAQQSLVPTGTVLPYAPLAAPDGYLLCFGQAVSRVTYAALFAAIGTTYGVGNGTTTFNLPDLRGRVVAGKDDMGSTSADRLTGLTGGVNGDVLGGTGGGQTHNHKGYGDGGDLRAAIGAVNSDVTALGYIPLLAANPNGGSIPNATYSITGTGAVFASWNHFTAVYGYTSSDSSVQPTIILNYIIKT